MVTLFHQILSIFFHPEQISYVGFEVRTAATTCMWGMVIWNVTQCVSGNSPHSRRNRNHQGRRKCRSDSTGIFNKQTFIMNFSILSTHLFTSHAKIQDKFWQNYNKFVTQMYRLPVVFNYAREQLYPNNQIGIFRDF